MTSDNDRRYRFSSNRLKRDTIESFGCRMHRPRIILYYRSVTHCDVIKLKRWVARGNVARSRIILYVHYNSLLVAELRIRLWTSIRVCGLISISSFREAGTNFRPWTGKCGLESYARDLSANPATYFPITRGNNKLIRLEGIREIIARIQIEKKFYYNENAREDITVKSISRCNFNTRYQKHGIVIFCRIKNHNIRQLRSWFAYIANKREEIKILCKETVR